MEVLARTKNQYPFLYGSTRYREKGEGTPTFSFDTNSETPGNAQRQFYIPWATSPQPGGSYTPWLAVWQAARDFLGYSVLAVNPADNRKYISRWIPLPFPGMVPQSPVPATGNSAVPSLSALRGFMYATSIVRAEGTVPQGNPASLALGALNQVVEGTGGATVAQFNEA
ncbi:MAG: hypothetical protein KGJ61_10255, partial [Candidatus Omnitrophica bacterium]|nr:hypothetical protein [Candidatus Omnitrophota bacterium]